MTISVRFGASVWVCLSVSVSAMVGAGLGVSVSIIVDVGLGMMVKFIVGARDMRVRVSCQARRLCIRRGAQRGATLGRSWGNL